MTLSSMPQSQGFFSGFYSALYNLSNNSSRNEDYCLSTKYFPTKEGSLQTHPPYEAQLHCM